MGVEYGCYGPDGRFLAITPMNHGAGLCASPWPRSSSEARWRSCRPSMRNRCCPNSSTAASVASSWCPPISTPSSPWTGDAGGLPPATHQDHHLQRRAAAPGDEAAHPRLFRRGCSVRMLRLDRGLDRQQPSSGGPAAQGTVRRPALRHDRDRAAPRRRLALRRGRGRGTLQPLAVLLQRLLGAGRGDRPSLQGRLGLGRRHGATRRRRLSLHRRPQEGPGDLRRRQHLSRARSKRC